jgi:RNA polymerase sigma-70 factor (ECF subfamily)
MSRQQERADAFELARAQLIRVAYAVLGSRHEAEDVVSETWLRLVAADTGDPVGDTLRSARSRREVYVGPWLPEPLITTDAGDDPRTGSRSTRPSRSSP